MSEGEGDHDAAVASRGRIVEEAVKQEALRERDRPAARQHADRGVPVRDRGRGEGLPPEHGQRGRRPPPGPCDRHG